MDLKTFKKVLRQTFNNLMKLTDSKGQEYAGSSDQLANFKRLGAQLGLQPEAVLWVYFTKHTDSLSTFIKEIGSGHKREYSEPITGRVDDAILYLHLLRALVMERTGEEPRDELAIDTDPITSVKQIVDHAFRCGKHGCVMTETIVDDIFCGVCRSWELEQKINTLTPRTVDNLQKEIRTWADSVFPDRTAQQALNKLVMDEIPEFLHGGLDDPLEYADLVILILDIADRMNIDVAKAVHEKMAINRKRKWKVDPTTGRAQHTE